MFRTSAVCSRKLDELKGKLFRGAQSRKNNFRLDDMIEERLDDVVSFQSRALQEFGLVRDHLQDLPRKELFPKRAVYSLDDVYQKALQVHGSERAIQQRMRLFQKYLYQNPIYDGRQRKKEPALATSQDASKAVKFALGTNFLDVCFKLYGSLITGSKSLAAEGLHSSLDLTNQIILIYGIRWSRLNPTPAFPYGYGNARYIASLISGCWLFGFGGGISLYHGITGLLHPHAIESPKWASFL
ncbi:unnamed protein product [Gongylonema pulchrum]|uniref:Cation efflux protein transmembrane domain-containing protein n=1 Tax=Gongylonema pulchrum TaxID=637853 RepID=A0A3P6PKC0_9BILA|nr:unnamed protein product [Gongylonema pulchrum]